MKQIPKDVFRSEGKGPKHYGCEYSAQCARWALLQRWTYFNCGECPRYQAVPEEKPPESPKPGSDPKDLPLCSECRERPVMTRKRRGGGEPVVLSICRTCYCAKINSGKLRAISGGENKAEKKDRLAQAARRGIQESRAGKGTLPVRESVVSQIRALRQYHLDEAERCLLAMKVMQGE